MYGTTTMWLCCIIREYSVLLESTRKISGIYKTHVCVCMYVCVCVLVAQLCPILCDPMDCSPPGSSVHGIHQARILEWVAMPFSRGSSQSGINSQTC